MKQILFSFFLTLSLTGIVFAGAINNIYVGSGYIGNGFTSTSDGTPLFDIQIGTGQRIELGKFILLGNEILNIIPYSGIITGYGTAISGVLGYKLLGSQYTESGWDIVPFAGAFLEADLNLYPFTIIYAYGPSVGSNIEYWFTPGFGMSFNAYLNINLVYFGGSQFNFMSPVMPSVGLSVTFRPERPNPNKANDDGWVKVN